MSLYAELKERRVFRAVVAYGIAAFAILQIVEPVMHGLHWPEMVLSYVVVALGLGFPLVIAIAWIFDERQATPLQIPRARIAATLLAMGIGCAAPGLVWYLVLRRPPPPSDGAVAVLPFATIGKEDTSYFTDGFHDEVLRQLGVVGGLQVISRTSVLQYRKGTRNLREIGEALGASAIVEGSVQRAGNRIRVSARLVDARKDRQVWADSWEEPLTDVFAIETAIAQNIARALRAKLSPAEAQRIGQKPTANAEAYDLYLRALDYDYRNRPDMRPSDLAISEDFFRQAIALDPSFALARARLAISLLARYWFTAGTPRSVVDDARQQALEAARLDPDLAQSHLALGFLRYYGEKRYREALPEFNAAIAGARDDAFLAIAAIQRRLGAFDESIRNYELSAALNPGSSQILIALAQTYMWARRYPDAQKTFQRALRLRPDADSPKVHLAMLDEVWKGDSTLARQVLRDIAPRLDPEGRLGDLGWIPVLMWLNPRESLELLQQTHAPEFSSGFSIWPRPWMLALAHQSLGEEGLARDEFAAAVPIMEENARKGLGYGDLAMAYAAVGRPADALAAARKAVQLVAATEDALRGSWWLMNLAVIEARVGEKDAAIAHIEELLAKQTLLSPALLRVDPRWRPLRDDPRFRRLAQLDGDAVVQAAPR